MTPSIPICFFATNKIILDDDKSFTDSMLLKLHGENLVAYNSPCEALNYILNHKTHLEKSDMFKNNVLPADSRTQHNINIDILKISQLSLLPFLNDISVLLIDYHMPEICGTDFLQQISHLPIKKVLITGEHDYKIAIDAFNSGLIDAYLRKDDPDFTILIQKMVSELEWKFFTDFSKPIHDIPDFHYLHSQNLFKEFQQYIQKNNIVSFYLADTQGTFITSNNKGKQSNLLIRNSIQLEELSRLAEEDGASKNTVKQLRNKTVIPFFKNEAYWKIPASEWSDFLYPASKIPDADLYWSVV